MKPLIQKQAELKNDIEIKQNQEAHLRQDIRKLQATEKQLNERIRQLNTTISLVPAEQLKGALEASPQVTSNLPPRVYVQIANEDQRTIAELVSSKPRSAGYIVAGIEEVGKKAPKRTDVRYFRPDDE